MCAESGQPQTRPFDRQFLVRVQLGNVIKVTGHDEYSWLLMAAILRCASSSSDAKWSICVILTIS